MSFATGVHPDFSTPNALGVPDFSVATSSGKIVAMRAACFEEPHAEQRRGEVMMESTPQVGELAAVMRCSLNQFCFWFLCISCVSSVQRMLSVDTRAALPLE